MDFVDFRRECTPAVADGTYRLRVAAPVGSGLGDGWYAAGAPGRLSDDGAADVQTILTSEDGPALERAALTLERQMEVPLLLWM